MSITKFNSVQKERIKRLEPALKIAATNGDVDSAKKILLDLKGIYLSTGNTAKFSLAKNRLFEAAMESGNLTYAIDGLEAIRKHTNNKTRVYLEATTLLAICYLRKNVIDKAEPLIKQVLINTEVIKSVEKRDEFKKLIVARFDEEAALYSLKDSFQEDFKLEEIADEASNLANKLTERELYINIGKTIPESAKNILSRVDSFSKKQLSFTPRLLLDSPITAGDNEKIGKTVFSSIKRVIYRSICDKKSANYKSYHGYSVTAIKSYLTLTIAEIFTKLSISIKALLISIIAIIIKLGLDTYCEHNKPTNIMDIR